jgi:amino acid adenylation domain-containing protein
MTTSSPLLATNLTVSQELIWLGQQMQPDSPLNNMAFAFPFGGLDVARMRAAFAKLVAASDAMRTVFIPEKGGVYQQVMAPAGYQLPFEDLTGTEEANVIGIGYCRARCRQPLDITKRCFDALLLKTGEDNYTLFINQHHLITDGWGYSVQLRYLLDAYADPATEPASPASFAAYVAHATVANASPKVTAAREAWKRKVADWPTPPLLYGRPNALLSPASTRSVRYYERKTNAELMAFIQRPEVRSWTPDLTLFTVYATALFAHLYRITGATSLTIGCPAHNRVTAADKITPGLFMELFPLHVELEHGDTFSELLDRVKVATMEFLRDARPGTSSAATGRSFNVVFNYINQSFRRTGDQEFSSNWLDPGETEPGHHFKLQVYDFDNRDGPTISFDTNDVVIPKELHSSATTDYVSTLRQLVTVPTTPIDELAPEEQRELAGFNTTVEDYPKEKTVLDLVEEQVAARRDKVAVQFRDLSLTYGELDARAEALAAELRKRGVGVEDLVAVCLDRSLEMMVALLGVLKAGAAYLPIDPEFPEERIAFLCADAGAKAVLTSSEVQPQLSALETEVLVVPARLSTPASSNPSLHPRPRPQNLMYLLYTSGSTGKPKGVMNQHDGLVNRLEWMQRTFGLDPDQDVVLQKTTFTFDVSGWEFWWPLIAGCRLVFAEPGGHKDADYLRRTIAKYGVTTLHFVPPMLEIFLLKKAELPTLKRVICSGEALTVSQVNTFRELYPHAELHNLYGPTEAAIDVTHWSAPAETVTHVPIGRPIANVPIKILGPQGQSRPVGVPGELYIGGVQVARGYLARPELTAEKFVALPEGRFYRTGDLCRWLPDGNIEFLGRIDSQVKLRGLRIELGEIEARLLEVEGVKQGTVLLRNDPKGEPALVAYLVTESVVEDAALREHLSAHLPAYMVPSFFIALPELPLLRNGKVDRKALPDPAFAAGRTTGEGPRTEFEEMIHEVWTEVFQIEPIGREAHFLDLGGHSLTGIRLISRINDAFELELPANTVFRFPTIAALAAHVEQTIRQLLEQMEAE